MYLLILIFKHPISKQLFLDFKKEEVEEDTKNEL